MPYEDPEWRIPPFKGRMEMPAWAKHYNGGYEFYSKCGKGYMRDGHRKRHEPLCRNCKEQ